MVPSGEPACLASMFGFVFINTPPPPPTSVFFVFIQTVVWKHLQRPGADGRLGLLRWVQQDLCGGVVCGGRAGMESASSCTCLSAGDRLTRQTLPNDKFKLCWWAKSLGEGAEMQYFATAFCLYASQMSATITLVRETMTVHFRLKVHLAIVFPTCEL